MVAGLAALELVWAFLANLRNHALLRLSGGEASGANVSGTAAQLLKHPAHLPSNFWAFLGISTGIILLGVLLSAWAHDPLASASRAVLQQRKRAEDSFKEAASNLARKRGELEALLAEEALLPERLALLERTNYWHARREIAQRASDDYHLTGYWAAPGAATPQPTAPHPNPLSGLQRLKQPLSTHNPPAESDGAGGQRTDGKGRKQG